MGFWLPGIKQSDNYFVSLVPYLFIFFNNGSLLVNRSFTLSLIVFWYMGYFSPYSRKILKKHLNKSEALSSCTTISNLIN